MGKKDKFVTITITVTFGGPMEFSYHVKAQGVNDFEILGILDQAKQKAMEKSLQGVIEENDGTN